jgi:hypothetical protein
VANRGQKCGLSFYRLQREDARTGLEGTPFQTVDDNQLRACGVASAHSVRFSTDGSTLLVSHKPYYRTEGEQGQSGVSVFNWRAGADGGVDPDPVCVLPHGTDDVHSAAFHPSGRFVGVTTVNADVDIFEWDPAASRVDRIDTLPVHDAKGIAFTPDGRQVAVTTEFDQVLFYSRWGR